MSVQPSQLTQTLPLLPIGDSTIEGAGRVIALANNENVESPSPAVLKACSEACASANWYPDITRCPAPDYRPALRQRLCRADTRRRRCRGAYRPYGTGVL